MWPWEVERRRESSEVIRILDAAVLARGRAPDFIRSANGPEFIAQAVQDWIARRGFQTLYIAPGSPASPTRRPPSSPPPPRWEKAYSESFNSRLRDEFLNRESFASVLEAKVLGKEYRQNYNHQRPHSALDYQTPAAFAQPPCVLMGEGAHPEGVAASTPVGGRKD